MLRNTQYMVKHILESLGGIPEECDWIDYKAVRCDISKETMKKMKSLIVSFVNSVREFGNNKFIIFGIDEDKKKKEKTLIGLNGFKFPDDNEWQNLINNIKPNHPFVETGTVDYKGLLFGYIFISAANYNVPYHYIKEGKETYYIRRGSNTNDDMTDVEKDQLTKGKEDFLKVGKVYPKSDIFNILVLLGQYNESNEADMSFIEKITEQSYDEIKSHCIRFDNSFSDKENSLYGLGSSEVVTIQNKHERLLQFTSNELASAKDVILAVLNDDRFYSEELLLGIADTLVFLTNSGFSFVAENIIEAVINFDSFNNYKYRNILQKMTESLPAYFLTLISMHKSEVFESELVIQSLRVIAWFPEYYVKATRMLLELNDKGIYELFMPTETATAASFEQKIELIKEISENDKAIAFEILNKVLYINPCMPTILSQSYVPEKYERFTKRSYGLDPIKLQKYYAILLECAGNCPEKLMELLPAWLQPFPFSNISLLVKHLEMVESTIHFIDDRQKLWNRLCNTPLVYITNTPLEEQLKQKLILIGEKFKPDDEYLQYQQWFLENVIPDMCIDGTTYEDASKKVFEEQRNILLAIYKRNGIGGVTDFIEALQNTPRKLSEILLSPEFPLTIEDDNALISAFLKNPKIYSSFFYSKSYHHGLKWIKEVNISNLNIEEKSRFFAALYPNVDNIKYFECVLGNEKIEYWKIVKPMCEDVLAIQYAFEQFIHFDIPQKAFSLLNNLQLANKNSLDSNWLFKVLMKQREYNERYIQMCYFNWIYQWLTNKIGDIMLEQIEELSFDLYGKIPYHYHGYEKFKPRITFKKIVNEPEFFIEAVKCAITDPLGVYEHLLKNCNAKPTNPQDWVKAIENLVTNEEESMKAKIECWIGNILYNALEIDSNGNYEIEDSIAKLLDESEPKRQGFFYRAYYPNGFHSNGSYEEDSNDRVTAERFNNFAEKQKENGYIKFGETLQVFANQLIQGVERMSI